MVTKFLAAAVAASFVAGAVSAATITPGVVADESKVVATGEFHIGDRGGAAQQEVRVDDLGTGGYDDQANFAWVNDTPYAFTFGYDGTDLSLDVAGTVVSASIDLGGADTIYLTARGNSGGSLNLTNLLLNGTTAIPDVTGANGLREWIEVTDFNFASAWSLTGNVSFVGVPGGNQTSRWNATIKVADVAPVPLPAPALLLLGGLGAFAALRRKAS